MRELILSFTSANKSLVEWDAYKTMTGRRTRLVGLRRKLPATRLTLVSHICWISTF